MAVNNRSVAAKEMEGALDKTLKAVIAAALIAASLVLPSFSFAQSSWMARVESTMRQTLPKEAKCARSTFGGTAESECEYETPKLKLTLAGSFEGATATVTFRPSLTQEERSVAMSMVYGFFKNFNFEQSAIRDCMGRGSQRTQYGPEQIKNTDKQFKLACYGVDPWTLIMRNNNEF
jgi:hypothetical protein